MYILSGKSHVFDSLLSAVISQTNVETKGKERSRVEKHLIILITWCLFVINLLSTIQIIKYIILSVYCTTAHRRVS